MSAYAVVLTGLVCFCLGAASLALLAWFTIPGEDNTEHERRQAEQQLHRMAHAAMVQMLAETRQARSAGRMPGDSP